MAVVLMHDIDDAAVAVQQTIMRIESEPGGIAGREHRRLAVPEEPQRRKGARVDEVIVNSLVDASDLRSQRDELAHHRPQIR